MFVELFFGEVEAGDGGDAEDGEEEEAVEDGQGACELQQIQALLAFLPQPQQTQALGP